VERARGILPEQSKHFDALVKQLEHRLHALDAQSAEVEQDTLRAKQLRAELEAQLEKQKARDQRALGAEAQRVIEEIKALRGELDRAKKLLRQQQRLSADELREVGRTVEQVAKQAHEHPALAGDARADEAALGTELVPEALAVGKRAYSPRLRAEVEIIEAPSRGRVRVAAGAMRLWIEVSELREPAAPKEVERGGKIARAPVPPRAQLKSSDNTLDLRGMRVDDALSMLDSFLDRLYGAGESVAYVEHGLGSGALRDAVRTHLAKPSPYVQSVRPGAAEEGGERLTVVTLR
jgi:DNA mismatch repair protein MutS2